MELQQSKPGRVRTHRTAEFKSRLIKLATAPGASMAGIAVAHGVNPNLLRRWIRESGANLLPAAFVPVKLENMLPFVEQTAPPTDDRIEVNIDRGGLHIQFKLNSSRITELGHVLREVLR